MSNYQRDAAIADAVDRERQDYLPGDPARHVVGKPDEQSARVHAPQPPKPQRPVPTLERIHRDLLRRMRELEPLVREAQRLEAAITRLKKAGL